jgi:hypothetical protein
VLHIDVDGARQAEPMWNLARLRFVEPQQAQLLPKLAIIERVSGMKLPQDLHDVTLFSTSFDPSNVCLRIHGNLDEANATAFLRADPEFRQEDHDGHTILCWRDKQADRLMYGTFARPDLAILSANSKAVADALDTLAGKADALKTDSPLAPPAVEAPAPQPIFWLAGDGLTELPHNQRPESPLLSQLDAASVSIKWVNDRALVELRLTAKTDKVALQKQSVAEGVKAFVALAASDEHATARDRLMGAVMQNLTTETDGKLLKGNWILDLDRIDALVNTIRSEPGPTAAPRAPANATP